MKFKFEEVTAILGSLGFERTETEITQRGGVPDIDNLKAGQKPPSELVKIPAYLFVHEDCKTKLFCKLYKEKDIVDETTLVGLEGRIEDSDISPGFSFEKYVMFSTLIHTMQMAKSMHDLSVDMMEHIESVMQLVNPKAFEKPKKRKTTDKSTKHDK